jgi:hypothetical protein
VKAKVSDFERVLAGWYERRMGLCVEDLHGAGVLKSGQNPAADFLRRGVAR